MVDRRHRVCVPIELEIIPLYREPGWSARLRREQRRERRRERRRQRRGSTQSRAGQIARLLAAARVAVRPRRPS